MSKEAEKYIIDNHPDPDSLLTGEIKRDSFMIKNITSLMQCYADQEVNKSNELLEKFTIGFEWNIENKPETIDKSDYEFYDEVKEYLESIKPKQ